VLILAVDTSSRTGSLAVLQDEAVIGLISTCSDENFSSRTFRQLEFLLTELSIKLEEFDLYAVASGPGSFTGLRVGLTAVKGWAEVYGKPIAAVGTLDAIAVQSHLRFSGAAAVMDARRGQVFGAVYKRSLNSDASDWTRDGEEFAMTASELVSHVLAQPHGGEVAIVTPNPELLNDALAQMGDRKSPFVVEHVSAILAPFVGQLGYRLVKRGQLTDSLALTANYVRRSDAEINWKNT
jgi:tRNA threonylcarbamoyladenosine biosynthesis protein TsaB